MRASATSSTSLHRKDRRDVWGNATWGNRVAVRAVARIKDPDRRRRGRRNFLFWCEAYHPEIFFDPNRFHLELAEELQRLVFADAITLLLKALAAYRGIGKTTVLLLFILWCACYGHRKFCIILCADQDAADERMAGLKSLVLRSTSLHEDFPELTGPVRAVGGDARAAAGATPDYPWSKDLIRLANGVYVACYGMDSSIAGRLKNFARPDMVLCDDCESVDTVKSPAETRRLRDRLFQEVMKLFGTTPGILAWICTIKAEGCLADELTDVKLNPEWRGKRYPALLKAPRREDLWAYFMTLLRPERAAEKPDDAKAAPDTGSVPFVPESAFAELTPEHQAALRFYAVNREAMDEGAEVLDAKRMPLHKIYYERALLGDKAWLCEVQQDPPEEEGSTSLQLEIEVLARRKVGPPRGVVPRWASLLFCTVDVGRYVCHWQADAWDAALQSSCLIDQGQQETGLNQGGEYKMTDDARRRATMVEESLHRTLVTLRERFASGWPKEDTGEILIPRRVGVDVGGTAEKLAWYELVLRFCHAAPSWLPMKGAQWQVRIADRAMARHWIQEQKNNPGRRVDCNADEYKTRCFNALAAPTFDKEGKLFTGTRIFHRNAPQAYLLQLTAERYVSTIKEEAPAGKEAKVGWNHFTRTPNHWWDTSWMTFALADISRNARGGGGSGGSGPRRKYGVVGRSFQ